MKKITAFLAILFLAAGCKQKEEHNGFEVSGKVLNLKGQKVLLEKIGFAEPNMVVEDSTTLGDDGSFHMKSLSKEEGIYRLMVLPDVQFIFVNDNDKIDVEINPKDIQHPIVRNSEATTELYNFLQNYSLQDSAILKLTDKAHTLMNSKTPLTKVQDSLLDSYDLQKNNMIQSLNMTTSNFIKQAKSPGVVAFVLAQASMSMDQGQVLELAEDAKKRFSDNKTLMQFYSILKQTPTAAATNPGEEWIGKMAPDLEMTDPAGNPLGINQFKGKYLLVDFWASWCGPCRAENPNVVAAYNKYKDKNFQILGVSLDKDKSSWEQAIKKDGLTWPQMSDLKFWESTAVETYKFDGIPFNVLIDPKGKIIATSLRGQDLENKLAEVLH